MEYPLLLTSTDETTFHIANDLELDSSTRVFCVGVHSRQSADEDAALDVRMSPCEQSDESQMWFMDEFGQLRLKDNAILCMSWNKQGYLAMIPQCMSDICTECKQYQFVFDMDKKEIVAQRQENSDKKYLGVRNRNNHEMKLFPWNEKNPNESIDKFYLTFVIYKSESPTSEPSSLPSQSSAPSSFPSTLETSAPSLLPSSAPSSLPSECRDEPEWIVGGDHKLYAGLTCVEIAASTAFEDVCDRIDEILDSTYKFKRVRAASFHLILSRRQFSQLYIIFAGFSSLLCLRRRRSPIECTFNFPSNYARLSILGSIQPAVRL